MNNAKKHTDVVASMEEFTTNYNNGVYTSPWVVYVGNSNDGYSVIYSNDENKHQNAIIPEAITSLTGRVEKLEDEKVYCYEDEYNILIEKGYGYVTTLDGIRVEVPFDETKWYCIYENEGPGVSGEPDEEGGSENIDDVNNTIKNRIESGGNFVLEDDVNLMNSIVLSDVNSVDSVVNLNGKTIQAGVFGESGGEIIDGDTDSYVFWVKKNSKLTINGNGVVKSQPAKYSMAVWAQGGKVTINGGIYMNDGEGSDLIYASNGGKIEIRGGEFIACEMKDGVSGTKQPYSILNIKDSDREISRITVYGGKFHGFNPGDNTSEGPNTSFLAEGYESVQVEHEPDVWIVQEKEQSE